MHDLLSSIGRNLATAGWVSRGERPGLAAQSLADMTCPVLLIVGGDDDVVINLNEEAKAQLHCPCQLKIVPGATHLFEEPGTLEQVADLAADWLRAICRWPKRVLLRQKRPQIDTD